MRSGGGSETVGAAFGWRLNIERLGGGGREMSCPYFERSDKILTAVRFGTNMKLSGTCRSVTWRVSTTASCDMYHYLPYLSALVRIYFLLV